MFYWSKRYRDQEFWVHLLLVSKYVLLRLKCPRFIHSQDSKTTATRAPHTIERASKTDACVLYYFRMLWSPGRLPSSPLLLLCSAVRLELLVDLDLGVRRSVALAFLMHAKCRKNNPKEMSNAKGFCVSYRL